MGFWSKTILGGDIQLDCIADLEDAAKINADDPKRISRSDIRAAINKNIDKVFKAAKKLAKEEEEDQYVGIPQQVLGVFLIEYGAKMTEEIRQFILEGIDKDEWAKSDKERKKFIDHFRKQIQRYHKEGSARGIRVAQEGLFEAMAKHIIKWQDRTCQ